MNTSVYSNHKGGTKHSDPCVRDSIINPDPLYLGAEYPRPKKGDPFNYGRMIYAPKG